MLKFVRIDKNAVIPTRGTPYAAGLDLVSVERGWLPPGQRRLVGTGLQVEIPEGMVGYVCPRSGLAIKKGVTVLNAPGVIDSDYRGEIKVILINLSHEDVLIDVGDRIAQLVIQKVEMPIVDEAVQLADTHRGTGGFGSTGK